jgi:hypothetical protein
MTPTADAHSTSPNRTATGRQVGAEGPVGLASVVLLTKWRQRRGFQAP